MSHNEAPRSVRIRTDDGSEWRFDAIQKAPAFYDCNRSNAVAFACEDINALVSAAQCVLERDDLARKQRREIAEKLSTRATTIEIQSTVIADTESLGGSDSIRFHQ